MGRAARQRRLVLLAGLIGLNLTACSGLSDDAIRIVRIYDLLEAMPRATIIAPAGEYITVRQGTLAGQERPALYMHPTSSAEFAPIEMGPRSTLTFSMGLDDAVAEKPGDGVEFTVSVKRPSGEVVKVFTQYLDPRKGHKGWVQARVPLGAFEGEKVRVVLATGSGPANDVQFDWAYWGEPVIMLEGR